MSAPIATPVLNTKSGGFNKIAARVQGADLDDEDILDREDSDDDLSDEDEDDDSDDEDENAKSSSSKNVSSKVTTSGKAPAASSVMTLESIEREFPQDIVDLGDLPDFGNDFDYAKWTTLALWQEFGYSGMLQIMLKDEISIRYDGSSTASNDDVSWIIKPATMICAAMHKGILKAVIGGNLALLVQTDTKIVTLLNELYKEAADKPSIYYQQFVDVDGNSPPPTELATILDTMEAYVEAKDHKLGNKVDIIKKPHVVAAKSKTAFRKYCWTSSGTKKANTYTEFISTARVKEITRLITNVRARIAAIPASKQNEPLKHPLVEVGYSKRSQGRLKKHASHSSSNYAMNLAEAVAVVLHNEGKISKPYKMAQFIIFICLEQSHGALSEIVLTRLAEGYKGNGGGFSHYPAGRSNDSALKTDVTEWNLCMQFAVERSPLKENLTADIARRKKKA
jgi:hypothetical protein